LAFPFDTKRIENLIGLREWVLISSTGMIWYAK
jgi:hypothetical protein